MIPDMSDVLLEWEQTVILKTVSTTTINFVKSTVIVPSDILAVVQVASAETLRPLEVDSSLRYMTFHSRLALDVGQYVEHNGIDYKLITPSHWADYGYSECVGEEVKGAIK